MVKRCVLAVMLLGGLAALPQSANAEVTCTQDLLNCYVNAAKIDNFWYRTAAGIDCELGYAGCVGQAISAD
jgi:hypothetical protein